jgi:hypothetical protein
VDSVGDEESPYTAVWVILDRSWRTKWH